MVNIILSTACIKKKKPLKFWQVFEACVLKSKPKKGWAAMGVLSGILESLRQPAVGKPKRHMRFWVVSCPKGLSYLVHPLPRSRCYTASPSNPLWILFWPGFFLLWEGCPAATLPFHIQGQLCWVRPKASNISPRQIPRKESKNRESNSLRHPHESVTPRLPEVVLLNMALHGTLFHWVI